MGQTITVKRIQEIAQTIVEKFQPEKIILFGSWAWGNPSQDSDVDLMIVKGSQQSRIDREREVQKMLWGTKVPVDVLVYTPEEIKRRLELQDFFIEDIIQKGKVIYSGS